LNADQCEELGCFPESFQTLPEKGWKQENKVERMFDRCCQLDFIWKHIKESTTKIPTNEMQGTRHRGHDQNTPTPTSWPRSRRGWVGGTLRPVTNRMFNPSEMNLDVLGHISGFIAEPTMASVNQTMRDFHTKSSYEVTAETIDQIMTEFDFPYEFNRWAIHLIVPSFPWRVLEKFPMLYAHPRARVGVRTLDLTILPQDVVGGPGAIESKLNRLLSDLDMHLNLEGLKLNLSSLSLDSRLLYFTFGRALQAVSIELDNNQIGDDGCEALYRGLRGVKGCKKLYLGLKNNQIGQWGMFSLSKIGSNWNLGSLETIHMDLEANLIDDSACVFLSDTLAYENLHTLHLNLKNNQIGDEGVARIYHRCTGARYRNYRHMSHTLRHLHINLENNKIGAEGFGILKTLMDNKDHLETLEINAKGNPGTP
jgi:hypothetical protein